jgi:hypothetical protein
VTLEQIPVLRRAISQQRQWVVQLTT